MKKIISVILISACLVTLAGCIKQTTATPSDGEQVSVTEATPSDGEQESTTEDNGLKIRSKMPTPLETTETEETEEPATEESTAEITTIPAETTTEAESTTVADVEEPTSVPYEADDDELTRLAKECINGKWGNGRTRRNKLTKAGYDYEEVQSVVNEIIEKYGLN